MGTFSAGREAEGEAARAGGGAASAGASDVRSSTAVISGTRNARMPHPPGTELGSGLTSIDGYVRRLIVSLDLQKRPVELMVAQGHRVEEHPEFRLFASHFLAIAKFRWAPRLTPRAFSNSPDNSHFPPRGALWPMPHARLPY